MANPNPNQDSLFDPNETGPADVPVNVRVRVNQKFIDDFKAVVNDFGKYTDDLKNAFSSMQQASAAGNLFGNGNTGNGPSSTASTGLGPPPGPPGGGPGGPPMPPLGPSDHGYGGDQAQDFDPRQTIPTARRPRPTYDVPEAPKSSWERAADQRGGALNQPFALPEFGAIQPDRLINLFGDMGLKRAQKRQAELEEARSTSPYEQTARQQRLSERYEGEESSAAGGVSGNIGRRLNQGAAATAGALTAYRTLRSIGNVAGVTGAQAAGVSAGYERGASLGPLMLPNYGSEGATGEGLRQNWTGIKIGMQSGISVAQGRELVQTLAGEGFTGDRSTTMAMDYLAPLVRDGQDIGQTTSMFTKGIRNGITSMSEMTDVLGDMGKSARSAQMNLKDYTEGINQFAETLQEGGATYAQGVKGARNMTTMLGVTPQQAQEVSASNMSRIGGMLGAGGTVLPSQVGAAMAQSPQYAAQAVGRGLDMVEASTINVQAMRDASGKTIMSQRDARDAQGAEQMGVSVETYKRLRQNRDAIPAAAELTDDLDKISSSVKGNTNLIKDFAQTNKEGEIKTENGRVKLKDDARDKLQKLKIEADRGYTTSGLFNQNKHHLSQDEIQQRRDQIKAVEEADENYRRIGHDGKFSFDTIEKKMEKLAPKAGTEGRRNWDKDLKKINESGDNGEKEAKLRKMIADRMGTTAQEDRNKVYVDLTPTAAKALKIKDADGNDLKRGKNEGSARYGGAVTTPSEPSYDPFGGP